VWTWLGVLLGGVQDLFGRFEAVLGSCLEVFKGRLEENMHTTNSNTLKRQYSSVHCKYLFSSFW